MVPPPGLARALSVRICVCVCVLRSRERSEEVCAYARACVCVRGAVSRFSSVVARAGFAEGDAAQGSQ